MRFLDVKDYEHAGKPLSYILHDQYEDNIDKVIEISSKLKALRNTKDFIIAPNSYRVSLCIMSEEDEETINIMKKLSKTHKEDDYIIIMLNHLQKRAKRLQSNFENAAYYH